MAEREKRMIPDIQFDYVQNIKSALNVALTESTLKISQLQALLEKTYGFNINKGTLANLFDVNNTNMDYACLVTTCKFFGLDFSEYLEPKELIQKNPVYAALGESALRSVFDSTPVENSPFMESLESVKDRFTLLTDDGYMGKFYGFIVSPSKSSESINDFTLDIWMDDGVTYAKFVRRSPGRKPFIYTGIPYYSKAYKAVLLFMTDGANGEFYFLSFGFQQYRTEEGLLFRQGLAITGESLGVGALVSQNFVLTKSDISKDKEKRKYIHGLLKAPNNQFCVPVVTVNRLAEEYPEVQRLLRAMPATIGNEKEEVYIMNEDTILSVERVDMSKQERIKALLLLKGESLVADKYYYLANSKYSGFGKQVLCVNDEEYS